MIWNIQIDKFIETLKKNKIEFKEVQGKIIIKQKMIRTPSILYKPLEIAIDGSVYKCQFYKMYHNTYSTVIVTREFIYMNSAIKYIKKYLKGEL